MLTKEEVLGIIDYCRRHNVPIKKRLSSLGIGEWTYYKSKKIYLGGHNTPGTGNNGGFVRTGESRRRLFGAIGGDFRRVCHGTRVPYRRWRHIEDTRDFVGRASVGHNP